MSPFNDLKHHDESDYDLDLDLLTILYQSRISCPREVRVE
jgi:hypothetical protein